MRTKFGGVTDEDHTTDARPAPEPDEPGRQHWDDAVDGVACYPHEEDGRQGLVVYDEDELTAWVWSDYYGPPIDRYDPIDERDADETEN